MQFQIEIQLYTPKNLNKNVFLLKYLTVKQHCLFSLTFFCANLVEIFTGSLGNHIIKQESFDCAFGSFKRRNKNKTVFIL